MIQQKPRFCPAGPIDRILLLTVLSGGCSYELDPDVRPGVQQVSFALAGSVPAPGETRVERNAVIRLRFSSAPDAESLSGARLRLFSGLFEVLASTRVDLLTRTIRFEPESSLRPNLRYHLFASRELRGLNGVTLASDIYFDFTTSVSAREIGEATNPPPTARDLQPLWQARCTSCHGRTTVTMKVDLSSPGNAVRSLSGIPAASGRRLRVVPCDHARSLLMLKLLDEGGIDGLAMPPTQGRLTASELRWVADWIDGGALP